MSGGSNTGLAEEGVFDMEDSKPSDPSRETTIDPNLLSRLRFCGRYGKTGRLKVVSADGKATADLYFQEGAICRLDMSDTAWLPFEANLEDRLFSLLRWIKPVASWNENDVCSDPEDKIPVEKLLSLIENVSLNRQSESWDSETCRRYSHKQMPVSPLELVVEDEEGVVQCYRFDKEDAVVGRSLDVDIMLDHISISRHHAFISCKGDLLSVTDLHSSNGTYLHGLQLQPMVENVFRLDEDLRLGSLHVKVRNAEPMTVAAYKLLAEQQLRRRMELKKTRPNVWNAPTKLLPKIKNS